MLNILLANQVFPFALVGVVFLVGKTETALVIPRNIKVAVGRVACSEQTEESRNTLMVHLCNHINNLSLVSHCINLVKHRLYWRNAICIEFCLIHTKVVQSSDFPLNRIFFVLLVCKFLNQVLYLLVGFLGKNVERTIARLVVWQRIVLLPATCCVSIKISRCRYCSIEVGHTQSLVFHTLILI